jgi:hypothetical protein
MFISSKVALFHCQFEPLLCGLICYKLDEVESLMADSTDTSRISFQVQSGHHLHQQLSRIAK